MTKISLISIDPILHQAFKEAFEDVKGIGVILGDIFTQNFDSIVSPANSFGFMDGGLDLLISEKLGWDIMEKLQSIIKKRPMGELLVGEAIIIKTSNENIRSVVCAPTMRTPAKLPKGSLTPYLAMKAILNALKDNEDIKNIGIPGLGTGVGEMNPFVAARQMRRAYDDFISRPFPNTWFDSKVNEWRIK